MTKRYHRCIRTQKESPVFLDIDYTSSGIWCKECGMNLTTKSLTELPDWLPVFIELWNDYGCRIVFENKGQNELALKRFMSIGEKINNLVNEYYVCELNVRRPKGEKEMKVIWDVGRLKAEVDEESGIVRLWQRGDSVLVDKITMPMSELTNFCKNWNFRYGDTGEQED